jgi:Mor family transcriptional regulator
MSENEVFDGLKGAFGTEYAHKISHYFAGSQVYFGKGVVISEKHQEIREKYKNGVSYRELASHYGYTEHHIRRIIHGRKDRNDKHV